MNYYGEKTLNSQENALGGVKRKLKNSLQTLKERFLPFFPLPYQTLMRMWIIEGIRKEIEIHPELKKLLALK